MGRACTTRPHHCRHLHGRVLHIRRSGTLGKAVVRGSTSTVAASSFQWQRSRSALGSRTVLRTSPASTTLRFLGGSGPSRVFFVVLAGGGTSGTGTGGDHAHHRQPLPHRERLTEQDQTDQGGGGRRSEEHTSELQS